MRVKCVDDIKKFMKQHKLTSVVFSSTLDFPEDFTSKRSTLKLVDEIVAQLGG